MICKNCGKEIVGNVLICPNCGAKTYELSTDGGDGVEQSNSGKSGFGAAQSKSGKKGNGAARLPVFIVPVVVGAIILIPLIIFLFIGKKNGAGEKDSQPEPQAAAAEQGDQTAPEQSDQTPAAEQGDQTAAEQSDQTAETEQGGQPAAEQSNQAAATEQDGQSERTAADQAAAEAQPEQEAADEQPALQAPGYTMAYGGHHYYIFDDGEISFSEAAEKCEREGGHLVKIDDYGENEALYDYMIDQGYEEAFLGLVYVERTGKWVNYDGSEATFFDWGTNSVGEEEPNNSGGSEYNVQMDVNMRGGHWNDAEFGAQVYTPDGEKYKDRYAYICEWDY